MRLTHPDASGSRWAVPLRTLETMRVEALRAPIFPFFGLLPLLGLAAIVLFVAAGVAGEAGMASERRGRWLPLVYYYLATVVGLALVLVGTIGGLHGLVTAALPSTSPEVIFSEPRFDRDGNPVAETAREKAEREAEARDRARLGAFADAIRGGITGLVGAPVFVWHLRQARRKEPEWLGAPPS